MRLGELLSVQVKDLNVAKRFVNCRGKNLFLNSQNKPFNTCLIQKILERIRNKRKTTNWITPHTFRRTLNTLRKKMGCDNETAKILLGHKINDVNIESYTIFNYEDYIAFFDKYNPYSNLFQ